MTVPPSLHTKTNVEIIRRFLPARIDVKEEAGKAEVSVG